MKQWKDSEEIQLGAVPHSFYWIIHFVYISDAVITVSKI